MRLKLPKVVPIEMARTIAAARGHAAFLESIGVEVDELRIEDDGTPVILVVLPRPARHVTLEAGVGAPVVFTEVVGPMVEGAQVRIVEKPPPVT